MHMTQLPALNDGDRAKIGAAVTSVESRTAGEIVTIVTAQSDDYTEVAAVWSALAAFAALAALALFPDFYLGLFDRLTGDWTQQWTPRSVLAFALLVAGIKFIGMWLIQLWRPLRLLLVPGPVKHARVRARAITCFKVGAERRTHGRTGILIYLSLRERRAEIVADEAIAGKVAPEVWGEAMLAMLAHIREGRIGEGMVAGIEKVGEVLAETLPRAADDSNELPDRLIEV
jgi:putative membrane protein